MGHLGESHSLRFVNDGNELFDHDFCSGCLRCRLCVLRKNDVLVLFYLFALLVLRRGVLEQKTVHDVHAFILNNFSHLVQDNVVKSESSDLWRRGSFLAHWHIAIIKIDGSCCVRHPRLLSFYRCMRLAIRSCPAHIRDCPISWDCARICDGGSHIVQVG